MTSVKKLTFLIFIAFLGVSLNAQEDGFTFRPFFGGGGGTAVFTGTGGQSFGGIGEFAVLFYTRGEMLWCAHIVGRGDSITTSNGNNYAIGGITGKVSLGGFLPVRFLRSYSFIEGGVGFGGGDGTRTSNMIFGGGGGIDLFFHRTGSIYLEAGYLQHFINGALVGGVSITIGTRGFFR